jgi:hypothetical protein
MTGKLYEYVNLWVKGFFETRGRHVVSRLELETPCCIYRFVFKTFANLLPIWYSNYGPRWLLLVGTFLEVSILEYNLDWDQSLLYYSDSDLCG